MKNRLSALRRHFAKVDDPYAGGDLESAQRMSTVLWGLVVLLVICLLPVDPPTDPSSLAGGIIAFVLVALGILLVVQCRRRRIASWRGVLAAGYGIAIGLGVMQWVTGGVDEPYVRLLLVPVILIAATQPPRQSAVFMFVVLVVLMSPFVYDHWNVDAAAGSIGSYIVWLGLAIAGNLLIGGVREQRLAMAAGQAQAKHEARIDSLTGLHNRRAFDEDLARAVNSSGRLGVPLSVAMIDIENFKQINDQWSYTEGDRALKEFGDVVQSTVRDPDQCYRWGGDEFCVILTGTPSEKTAAIAERLRLRVEERLKRPDGEPIRIRFAVAEHENPQTARELADMAGMALTTAKMGAR